jgi:DNA-binding PadR family transcriptional regulator
VLDRYIGKIYLSPRMKDALAIRRRVRENRTRYVVLGMLSEAPLTGYGLRQAIASSVGHFWQESYGQLYPTLRALAAEGLVEARATQGGPGRPGATYHVTARGRDVLAAWLAVPPVMAAPRNEILLKVFFAGIVAPEVTVRNLEGVAAQLGAQRAALEGIARVMDAPGGGKHPDARYWRLTLDFGLGFTAFALAWLDRVKTVLHADAAAPRPSTPRAGRAARDAAPETRAPRLPRRAR